MSNLLNLLLDIDGDVWSWGDDEFEEGALGHGNRNSSLDVPTKLNVNDFKLNIFYVKWQKINDNHHQIVLFLCIKYTHIAKEMVISQSDPKAQHIDFEKGLALWGSKSKQLTEITKFISDSDKRFERLFNDKLSNLNKISKKMDELYITPSKISKFGVNIAKDGISRSAAQVLSQKGVNMNNCLLYTSDAADE